MTHPHHATCQHEAYRLTCEDFEDLWQRAGGCCEICGTPAADTQTGKLGIDHAQEYGYFAVRGLLCAKCNSFMRYVDRGQKNSRAAREYMANAWFVRVLHARHEDNKAAARQRRRAA